MKLLFISGPYRSESISQINDNIYRARVAMLMAMKAGWAVICPHTLLAGSELLAAIDYIPEDVYMNVCLELLRKCDAIYMLEGWEKSEGSKVEHHFAECWDIEIYYENKNNLPHAA